MVVLRLLVLEHEEARVVQREKKREKHRGNPAQHFEHFLRNHHCSNNCV